jgi:hypothetical protein
MAIDEGKPAPPADLRDSLMIWLFATGQKQTLDGIKGGTITPPVLQAMLESRGFIRQGNSDNAETCTVVVADILANKIKFTKVQEALTSIPILKQSWSGGPAHPEDVELNNVLNVAQPLSRLTAARSATSKAKKASSKKKQKGTRRRRK